MTIALQTAVERLMEPFRSPLFLLFLTPGAQMARAG